MPRIRYRKDWDFTLYEDNNDTLLSEQGDEEINRSGREIIEEESGTFSGNSWLSNANIISQLTDARIKESIRALKAQIKVMEAELLSRYIDGRHVTRKNWSEIGDPRPRKDGAAVSPTKRNIRGRDKGDVRLQKVASLRKTLAKLGVKDVNALLDEWSKIQKGKSE